MRFVLSFIKILKMSRLFRQEQDQDQDFFFKTKTKTKTKTIFHVLEAPRDQDQDLKTTSLVSEHSNTDAGEWKSMDIIHAWSTNWLTHFTAVLRHQVYQYLHRHHPRHHTALKFLISKLQQSFRVPNFGLNVPSFYVCLFVCFYYGQPMK